VQLPAAELTTTVNPAACVVPPEVTTTFPVYVPNWLIGKRRTIEPAAFSVGGNVVGMLPGPKMVAWIGALACGGVVLTLTHISLVLPSFF